MGSLPKAENCVNLGDFRASLCLMPRLCFDSQLMKGFAIEPLQLGFYPRHWVGWEKTWFLNLGRTSLNPRRWSREPGRSWSRNLRTSCSLNLRRRKCDLNLSRRECSLNLER